MTSGPERQGLGRPDLVERLLEAQRDPAATEAFLIEIYPVVSRFFSRALGADHPWVDDLTQETTIKVYDRLSTCRSSTERSVVAWALQVARNTWIDLWRSGALLDRSEGGTEELSGWYDDAEPSDLKLLLQIVARAQDQLGAQAHEILYLRLVENASWSTVGDAMGLKASAAKRRFQRAQVKIRGRVLGEIRRLPPAQRAELFARLRSLGASVDEFEA